jgi:hypothetical protein
VTGTGTRQAARVGGVAAAFAGIAIALLQGLQGLIGSFNPRWEVGGLFALAVLAGSLWLQRLNARSKEASDAAELGAVVQRSVAAWPVPALPAADPVELGVFPTRRDERKAAYIPRTLDAELAQALRRSPLVIVVGPPRAGKSRSALQCAQHALPSETAVIVPSDAGALRQLLEVDSRLRFEGLTGGKRLLWLDDLERFVAAIDAEMLERLERAEAVVPRTGRGARLLNRLAALGRFDRRRTTQACDRPAKVDPAVAIVASLREDRWRRLLSQDGEDTDVVKAIVARAHVLKLPLQLDPDDELPDAKRLYPRRDFSRGIGPALASSGAEPPFHEPEPADAAEPRPIGGPPEARRDVALLAPAIVSVVSLAIVVLLWASGNFEKPKPLTIAEQAANARREGSAGPRTIVDTERVDFHGSGEPSYFFAFGDAGGTPPARARAHELQIWDQHGDELRRAFRFEPRQSAIFQFRFIGDVDGDGADELIGGFGDRAILGELLLPFALDWDEDAEGYRLISLAPVRARLASRARGRDAKGLRAAYRSHFRLRDIEGGRSLAGYRSQDFAVTPNPARLVSAYVADIDEERQERLVELQPHTFDRTGGMPAIRRCRLVDGGNVVTDVPSARRRSLHTATLERWLKLSKDRFCVVFG